jgi:hypothetical protein
LPCVGLAPDLIKKAFDEHGIKFAFPTVQVAGEGEAATATVAHRTLELTQPRQQPNRRIDVLYRLSWADGGVSAIGLGARAVNEKQDCCVARQQINQHAREAVHGFPTEAARARPRP